MDYQKTIFPVHYSLQQNYQRLTLMLTNSLILVLGKIGNRKGQSFIYPHDIIVRATKMQYEGKVGNHPAP